jgi:DNA mismatch repair protein MutL
MPIHVLPSDVASQIAAGEVIERPASVVKELLENAIDAGAGFISVNIEGAGKRLIEVADDGSGISSGDLPIAVERHATSKLNTAEDLFHVTTLGFRGEALASISSVARVTITSRTGESPHAARLVVEAGVREAVNSVGAPVGTVVRVENLFFNVPARLKFLKSELTERRHIDELVTRYALAYPRVRIHLKQEGKAAIQTSGNNDRREILASLYGAESARQMLEVLAGADGINLIGYISPISITRSNRKEITFFVNGRPVQDIALTSALVQAYHTMLMVGRYPMAVLFIELSPEEVDVNVHPTKAEVRFRNPHLVFSAVQNGVRRALLAHTPVPGLNVSDPWLESQARWGRFLASLGKHSFSSMDEATPETSSVFPGKQIEQPRETQAEIQQVAKTPILRLVGQVAAAYLVAEGPDGLYLIDQHAAHERVLFEEFLAINSSTIPAQTLLQPISVELSPSDVRLINDQLPILNQLGFIVEPFGPRAFLVRAVPVLFAGLDPSAALRVLIEDFEEDETPLQSEVQAKLIARVCKRAAIKAGQVLSVEEQRGLLSKLEGCRSPRTCPHGRPTMIHLSVDLLERQFGRKGPR